MLTDQERQLLLIVQEGLPLSPEPYAEIASRLGAAEEQVIETLRSLLERAVFKRLGGWPYNLFAMVHGTSREEVLSKIAGISRDLGLASFPHDVLFSTRLLKKQGTRLRNKQATAIVE